ncbi:hypothetical protein D3C84_875590 [compost metagenome]
MPPRQRVGRVLAHRRAPRGAPEQGALQHADPHEQPGRDRPEVPQDHAVGAHRGLVPGRLHLRERRPQGHEDEPDHLRRRQLPRDLARLRDARGRAHHPLPGLHVPGQGAADHGLQGHGLHEQHLRGGGQRGRLRRRVLLFRPLGHHRFRRPHPGRMRRGGYGHPVRGAVQTPDP